MSTERKLVGPFRLSYKTVVKDDWKEQEPEAELSVKHLKLSIAHYFNPIIPGGGGLRGPDGQTHSCQSGTSYPMMHKLGDF